MTADHEVQLETRRLLLRPFCPSDAESLHAAVRESMNELGRWLSWCHVDYAMEDSRSFLAKRSEAFERDGEYSFAIVERDTGRLVGACGLNQIERAALRANLGYWMRTSAANRGYATEAASHLARWAFEFLGLERIEIVAAVGNLASQRVAAKVGATRESVARNRLRIHGVQTDAVVFSLIRSDVLA